ncbi:hypothetical protein IMZ48_48875 [Candidatus Bathyarchaeota archaeon]|nr:hypothetical protein [Candidatus Bathyarchaeota archaeon]
MREIVSRNTPIFPRPPATAPSTRLRTSDKPSSTDAHHRGPNASSIPPSPSFDGGHLGVEHRATRFFGPTSGGGVPDRLVLTPPTTLRNRRPTSGAASSATTAIGIDHDG